MEKNYFKRVWGVSKSNFRKKSGKSSQLLKNFRGCQNVHFFLCFDTRRFITNSFFNSFVIDSIQNATESNSHDVSSAEVGKNSNGNIRQYLTEWAIKHNVPQTGFEQLSTILRQHTNFNLPKSAKTILKTPQNTGPISVDSGTYCHIGAEKTLKSYFSALTNNKKPLPDSITLDFNIDEVSCSKSTQIVLWLIQMSLRGTGCNPFVVGAFHGKNKPDCNSFLKPFVDELNVLRQDGVNFKNKVVCVDIGYFSCDTPAVSYIRGSKGPQYWLSQLCKMYTERITFGFPSGFSLYNPS